MIDRTRLQLEVLIGALLGDSYVDFTKKIVRLEHAVVKIACLKQLYNMVKGVSRKTARCEGSAEKPGVADQSGVVAS